MDYNSISEQTIRASFNGYLNARSEASVYQTKIDQLEKDYDSNLKSHGNEIESRYLDGLATLMKEIEGTKSLLKEAKEQIKTMEADLLGALKLLKGRKLIVSLSNGTYSLYEDEERGGLGYDMKRE